MGLFGDIFDGVCSVIGHRKFLCVICGVGRISVLAHVL